MADSHAPNHQYHLVDPSPWPIVGSIGALLMAVGGIGLMRYLKDESVSLLGIPISGWWIFAIGVLVVLYTFFMWWRDVIKEAQVTKDHTPVVQLHLRYGMILFIAAWSILVGIFLVILSFRARSFGKQLTEAQGEAAS